MNDYSNFNVLQVKIQELRRKKDEIQGEVLQDRLMMTQLDEQIAQMEREKQRMSLDFQMRDDQIRKYNDLIDQSEMAMDKMMLNSRKLNDALGYALEDRTMM
jgi:chromosome segregation ATPase